MFKQTLIAQLCRLMVALVITLTAVHHSELLLNALAEHAVSAGCHSMDSLESMDSHEHHHMTHHHVTEHHHH